MGVIRPLSQAQRDMMDLTEAIKGQLQGLVGKDDPVEVTAYRKPHHKRGDADVLVLGYTVRDFKGKAEYDIDAHSRRRLLLWIITKDLTNAFMDHAQKGLK